ncbi:KTSC domain-containing protein [Parapedobacter defluvii]
MGREYLFQNMPIEVWNKFRVAKSHGEFYNQSIRNKYLLKLE